MATFSVAQLEEIAEVQGTTRSGQSAAFRDDDVRGQHDDRDADEIG